MCGVSGIELIIIVVAAVVFLGPDRLPDLARTVGKLARDLRSATDEFTQAKDEFTKSIDPKKLLGDEKTTTEPRRRPGAAASRDAAAIAAIREQKEKAAALKGDAVSLDSAGEDCVSVAVDGVEESTLNADSSEAPATDLLDESDEVPAFSAPPLDPKYSADGETEWLRKRLQDAAERRSKRSEASDGADAGPSLPKIRPASGSIAVGEGVPDAADGSDLEDPSTTDDSQKSPESPSATADDHSDRGST